MINDAVLIQHTYSNNNTWSGNAFLDMQRLTYQRHASYCAAHNIDYWNFQGGKFPQFDGEAGSWTKVGLVKDALKDYEFVFWIDVDTAIVDFETDLREAAKDIHIGGCVHDPAKSEFLKFHKVDRHINVGCLYFRSTDKSQEFMDVWCKSYPGAKRWAEQGAFNELTEKMPDIVTVLDDKWNATVNVNMVKAPVVMGWHGVPLYQRFLLMKQKFINDHLDFRV